MAEMSDYGTIIFSSLNGFCIQSIDASAICVHQMRLPLHRLKVINQDNIYHSSNFKINELLGFLKRHTNAILFKVSFNTICVQFQLGITKHKSYEIILNSNLHYKYCHISLPVTLNKPTIVIDPINFNKIVMNLAVGGGYTKMNLNHNSLTLTSDCEVGSICIDISVGKQNCNHFTNTFVTKFLKPLCTTITFAQNVCMTLKHNKPLEITYTLQHELIHMYTAIAPINM